MRHDGTTEFRKGLRNKKKIRYSPRTAFLFPLVQLLQRRKSMRQENAHEKEKESENSQPGRKGYGVERGRMENQILKKRKTNTSLSLISPCPTSFKSRYTSVSRDSIKKEKTPLHPGKAKSGLSTYERKRKIYHK
jgi:hypothetical protein